MLEFKAIKQKTQTHTQTVEVVFLAVHSRPRGSGSGLGTYRLDSLRNKSGLLKTGVQFSSGASANVNQPFLTIIMIMIHIWPPPPSDAPRLMRENRLATATWLVCSPPKSKTPFVHPSWKTIASQHRSSTTLSFTSPEREEKKSG